MVKTWIVVAITMATSHDSDGSYNGSDGVGNRMGGCCSEDNLQQQK